MKTRTYAETKRKLLHKIPYLFFSTPLAKRKFKKLLIEKQNFLNNSNFIEN